MGADGTVLRANKAELELLGFAAHEYMGHHIAEFHADQDVIENMLARLNVGERLDRYPARLRARDGSIKHVEITSSAQFRDGRFINTRCFTIDVSELKRAREDVHRKDNQFRQVLEALPAAVYTTDPAGKITYYMAPPLNSPGVNPRSARRSGA